MRAFAAVVALAVLAAIGACRQTGEGQYEVDRPVIGTEKDTVNVPDVDVGTKKDTITVPDVDVKERNQNP